MIFGANVGTVNIPYMEHMGWGLAARITQNSTSWKTRTVNHTKYLPTWLWKSEMIPLGRFVGDSSGDSDGFS